MNIDKMGDRTVRVALSDLLESNNNFKKILLFIGLMSLSAFYLVFVRGQDAKSQLQSQKIILQGNSGQSGAEVVLSKQGPSISMLNEKGEERVTFYVEAGVARVSLKDEKGYDRVVIKGGQENPSVVLVDVSGNELVNLDLSNLGPNFGLDGAQSKIKMKPIMGNDEDGFAIVDASGKNRIKLVMDAQGGKLSFYDQEGAENTVVTLNADGPQLSLLDINKLERARCALSDGAEPMLAFFDSLGRKRAELSPKDAQAELMFYDDNQVPRQAINLSQSKASLRLIDFDVPAPPAPYLPVEDTDGAQPVETHSLIENQDTNSGVALKAL